MSVVRQLPHLAWLVAVWVALWGDVTVANLLGGTLVALGISVLFPQAGPRPAASFRVVAACRYLGVFAVAFVQANYRVARQVLSSHEPHPAIVAVSLQGVSDAVVTLVANTITLTPGTLTLDIDSDRDAAVLYIHVLDLHDPDAVRREVRNLQYLAIEAFGHEAARNVNVKPVDTAEEVRTA